MPKHLEMRQASPKTLRNQRISKHFGFGDLSLAMATRSIVTKNIKLQWILKWEITIRLIYYWRAIGWNRVVGSLFQSLPTWPSSHTPTHRHTHTLTQTLTHRHTRTHINANTYTLTHSIWDSFLRAKHSYTMKPFQLHIRIAWKYTFKYHQLLHGCVELQPSVFFFQQSSFWGTPKSVVIFQPITKQKASIGLKRLGAAEYLTWWINLNFQRS